MLYRNGQPITVTRVIATGGEGRVCEIREDHTLVLKHYHQQSPVRTQKLSAMISNPPTGAAVAWPRNLVHDENGRVAGYLMPKVANAVPLALVTNPTTRANNYHRFNWRYLANTATNIARTIAALHDAGHVVGDLGPLNILVHNNATVTMIDCDSYQVSDGRRVYRCPVGTEECTPPELHGKDFANTDRNPHHDDFGLSVITFRLLMDGTHPFAGKWTGTGEPPSLAEKIRHGSWPYVTQRSLTPPPMAPPLGILPGEIQALFAQCFIFGHQHPPSRPSTTEWHAALSKLVNNTRDCPRNKNHYYSNHLSRCPWCERATRIGIDTFPTTEPSLAHKKTPTLKPILPTTRTLTPSLGLIFTTVTGRQVPPGLPFIPPSGPTQPGTHYVKRGITP